MSQSVIIAGVGSAQVYSLTGEHILTSKILVNSGISFSTTLEEIRGSEGNILLGQYAHDSGLTLTLEDALFSLKHLSLNLGNSIQVSGDVITTEQVTVATANQITVTNTPKDFMGFGTVGYYKFPSESDDAWRMITFSDKTASVEIQVGEVVCVKYAKADVSAEKLIVSASFIPSQASVILTLPMYRAGTDKSVAYTSASKIGEIQIKVPRFMFDGASELSLTSTGAATSSLTGKALATYDGTSCDEAGTYAEIIAVTYGKDEFADVKSIVIYDSDIELEVPEKQILEVYAIYGGVTAPRKIDNSKITFTMETGKTGVATVDATGEITSVGAGQAYIEAMVTGHTNLVAMGVITVTEP